jgi:asparagine synthase (glutamine-hydrolysing)
MSYSDFKIWLVEDILVKIDRASMANSLEMRSPFLDSTVVDFALNYVPGKLKATSYSNKSILKELGKKILPKEFDIQRKQGFCLPIDELFRSDLWGDYFKANLNSLNSDLLNKKAALDILNQHHNGYIHGNRLFCILIFMVWLNKYQDVLQ